jgi:hypothetical protein
VVNTINLGTAPELRTVCPHPNGAWPSASAPLKTVDSLQIEICSALGIVS